MNSIQLLVIIFFSAFTGWFISWLTIKILFWPAKPMNMMGIKLQGLLPARQDYLAREIGNELQSEFTAYKGLDEKLADPALLEKLKPEIEAHVDHFLKEKLKEVFPILAQFMGEKTISQFKTAFLTEIDNLLPALIKNYTNELKSGIRIDQLLSEKINGLSMARIRKNFYARTKKERSYFIIACTCVGLITGIITSLIIVAINI